MKKIFDRRGWFLPLPNNTNVSFSKKGVFRGLHAQTDKPQGKHLFLLSGSIIDVFVSPSGQVGTMKMVAGDSFTIPPGFFHGFYAEEDSMLLYICSEPYNPKSEIGIHWTYARQYLMNKVYDPILSDKDSKLPDVFILGDEGGQ